MSRKEARIRIACAAAGGAMRRVCVRVCVCVRASRGVRIGGGRARHVIAELLRLVVDGARGAAHGPVSVNLIS